MAIERKTNTGEHAMLSLINVIGTVAADELKNNPKALAEVNKMTADVKDSHLMTAVQLNDKSIEAYHDAADAAEAEQEEQAEAAGEADEALQTLIADEQADKAAENTEVGEPPVENN